MTRSMTRLAIAALASLALSACGAGDEVYEGPVYVGDEEVVEDARPREIVMLIRDGDDISVTFRGCVLMASRTLHVPGFPDGMGGTWDLDVWQSTETQDCATWGLSHEIASVYVEMNRGDNFDTLAVLVTVQSESGEPQELLFSGERK